MLISNFIYLMILVLSAEWAAAQMSLQGTSSAGRRLFHSPMISKNGLSCGDCHSDFDEKRFDDGRIRAGHSLYNSYFRQTWWGKDPKEPGAYSTAGEAAVVCVIHYMRNPEKLTAQQILDLTAYLKAISKKSVQPPLAIAPAADKTGVYAGFDKGNHVSGKELFYAACHSCHPNGNSGIAPDPLSRDKPSNYYARIVREGDGLGSVLSGVDPTAYSFEEGRFKPFFGADRLTDVQIADIIAYIKTLPPIK